MSNGLDNFHTLGSCWYFVVFAFASLTCFADFQNTDSQNLSQIRSYVSSIQKKTENIATYWYSFNEDSVFNGIVDYEGTFYHPVMTMDVTLLDRLALLQSLILAPLTNISRHVRSVDDTFTQYASDESNRFVQLQASIGNVTNTLDFWGQAIVDAINSNIGVGVVNTNLPFLLSEIFSSSLRSDVTALFDSLYGHTIPGYLINDLVYLYTWFGGNATYSQDNLSQLVFLDELHGLYSPHDGTYDAYSALLALDNYIDNQYLYPIAEARYYEYGTRSLTDSFLEYTNDFSNLSTNILDFFTRATNEYPIASVIESDGDGGFKFSSVFGDAVGDLAQSFTDNVESNVTPVVTNAIMNVEDSSYNAEFNKFTEENFKDTSSITVVSDAVASINNQFSSFLPEFSSSDTYTFDFGSFEIFDSSYEISFEISKPGSLYWSMQSFFFAVLKAIALFIAVHAMYYHISADTTV